MMGTNYDPSDRSKLLWWEIENLKRTTEEMQSEIEMIKTSHAKMRRKARKEEVRELLTLIRSEITEEECLDAIEELTLVWQEEFKST